MATNAFNVCHHRSLRRCHSLNCPPLTVAKSLFFKPAAPGGGVRSLVLSATFSAVSSATSTSQTDAASGLELLQQHLSSRDFRQADEETRRLLIVLAGEPAQKRGYVFFSEVQFIPADDLRAIDSLWQEHSDGRFGYSVQRRIWEKVNRDFTRFFITVRWMKKLEGSEVEQYNYRSFPAEFVWEISDASPPEGHLPLTNALRGTQLLNSILTHPAFQEDDTEEEKDVPAEGGRAESRTTAATKTFKPNYSF